MPIAQAADLFETSKQEALEWLQKEVASLRSGRVKPDIVEALQVEAYGARTPLNGLASVSSSDARTLVISPWDKSTMASIEKAITEAGLGVQPIVDGNVIRLSFPSLTEEVRQQTIKLLHAKAEESRVRMRQGRDEALRLLKQEKEKGEITEDDFYDGKKQLDDLIGKANEDVEDVVTKKEEDIKTI
jgi:ribosome recycling factor